MKGYMKKKKKKGKNYKTYIINIILFRIINYEHFFFFFKV